MNKFVILGCGYIGTNFANYIVQANANDKVYVLGIKNEYTHYLNSKVTFISKKIEQIDEKDLEMFKDALVFDCVDNLNATNSAQKSSSLFLKNCSTKVELIQLLNTFNIKKYIFLSSGGTVYGDTNKPHEETEKYEPTNVYALGKVIQENYLNIFNIENNNFNYLIFRLSNPYGGYISKSKKQGIIDIAINKCINNEELEFYGDIKNVRDYIYIEDLAKYMYKLAISNANNSIYNIGSGIGTSTEEVFTIIENLLQKKINLKEIENQTVNIKSNILSMKKTNDLLGNIEKITVQEGIEKIISKKLKEL